jgi:hypothetical protein
VLALLPAMIAVYEPGRRVAKIADSRASAGWWVAGISPEFAADLPIIVTNQK